jgi:hypothetical protein
MLCFPIVFRIVLTNSKWLGRGVPQVSWLEISKWNCCLRLRPTSEIQIDYAFGCLYSMCKMHNGVEPNGQRMYL